MKTINIERVTGDKGQVMFYQLSNGKTIVEYRITMAKFDWLVDEFDDCDKEVLTSSKLSPLDIVTYMNDKFESGILEEIVLFRHKDTDDYYLAKEHTVEVYTYREVFNVKED